MPVIDWASVIRNFNSAFKMQGENVLLDKQLQAVVDIDLLLGVPGYASVQNTFSSAQTLGTVPSNKIWIIHNIVFDINAPAADTNIVVYYMDSGSTQNNIAVAHAPVTVATAENWYSERGIYVPAGGIIKAVGTLGAVGANSRITVYYRDIPAIFSDAFHN